MPVTVLPASRQQYHTTKGGDAVMEDLHNAARASALIPEHLLAEIRKMKHVGAGQE